MVISVDIGTGTKYYPSDDRMGGEELEEDFWNQWNPFWPNNEPYYCREISKAELCFVVDIVIFNY